jgi:hypothetical protein
MQGACNTLQRPGPAKVTHPFIFIYFSYYYIDLILPPLCPSSKYSFQAEYFDTGMEVEMDTKGGGGGGREGGFDVGREGGFNGLVGRSCFSRKKTVERSNIVRALSRKGLKEHQQKGRLMVQKELLRVRS